MESIDDSIDILKALADKTRLLILNTLQTGPLTAGEIEENIQKSQSATSLQLKKLVELKILKFTQDGTKKFFEVINPQIFDLLESIQSYISITEARQLEENSTPRILLMGLNESGKTSILLSLLGNKNLLTYYSPPPTLGYKHMREITGQFNIPFPTSSELKEVFWEAGGQAIYRGEYLNNPEKYLEGFNRIIYVIDVQDINRYTESLEYLDAIIQKLKDLEEKCVLSVYLHKFDPGLHKLKEYKDEKINSMLINKIIQMIPPEFNYEIVKTSIFTVFRKTMVMQSIRS